MVFWKEVRNKSFWNIDFDRQRVIGNYIVDFYVKALGLVIEIDGEIHNEKLGYDKVRDDFLKGCGIKVLRFTNEEVLENLEGVMERLVEFLDKKS